MSASANASASTSASAQVTTTTITESGRPVWRDGSYVPGVAGVTAAREAAVPLAGARAVEVEVTSGDFRFAVLPASGG